MQKKIGWIQTSYWVLDFNSMEELMENDESTSHNEREKGIVGVCFDNERRVLEKGRSFIDWAESKKTT